MERLTEEKQIGPWASLKDKAEAIPGAFANYDCLMAHMSAVTRLKAYEDTGMNPEEIERIVDAYGRGMTLRQENGERLRLIHNIRTDRLQKLVLAYESGRFVVLPCKVGDTVYCILRDSSVFYPDTDGWYISEETVCEITTKGLILHEIEDGASVYVDLFDQVGKTIFLTREEAEKALAAGINVGNKGEE